MLKANNKRNGGSHSLCQFFYGIVYSSYAPTYIYTIFWLIQYFSLLSPSMLYILYEAEISSVRTFFEYFNILTYINNETTFSAVSYGLFIIIQLFLINSAYLLYWNYTKGRETNENQINRQILFQYMALHIFFIVSHTILLQINTDLLHFLSKSLYFDYKISEYKNYTIMFDNPNPATYLNFAFLIISGLELIFINIIYSIFCQDRSLLNKLFWSPNVPYSDFIMILIQISTRSFFIFIQLEDFSFVFL